ncbi:putative type VI secretion system effector [Citrobacter farmeri]|uniref:putative type VI secretion system effector n=1 Tax=Citrobacter farmeri TaxID=67824 RepID=UPI0018A948CB|nr:putative type VI secretion system effector [Citrobacter farmeri]MDB2182222.1 hypothetical protein [Citrobacter farmeri]
MNSMETNGRISNRYNLEPENILSLRRSEDAARINQREWSRVLPPQPVLPSFGELKKIKGRIESFSSEFYLEYFGVKRYRTNTLPEVSDTQRTVGAAFATVAGSPATGILLAQDNISESIMNRAEYVQGVIDKKPFRGWVGLTRLQPGDEVEMVVDWQGDHYEVYAIAKPAEHVVSVCPGCLRGRTAEAWLRLKNIFFLTFSFLFIFISCLMIHSDGSFIERLSIALSSHYAPLLVMLFFIGLFFFGIIGISAYRANATTTCKFAEDIFSTLGMESVEKINLSSTTKIREKELKRKGAWYSPKDKTRPACPTATFMPGYESWYYY